MSQNNMDRQLTQTDTLVILEEIQKLNDRLKSIETKLETLLRHEGTNKRTD